MISSSRTRVVGDAGSPAAGASATVAAGSAVAPRLLGAVVDVAVQAPEGAALDLHEELSHPTGETPSLDGRFRDPRTGGCKRWPERLWLLSSQGERVPGRCRSTNLCEYCARLVAVENTEMLALDAMEGDAPEVWCVLTTRTATLDMARFYRARELVIRALRRRWPTEYAALLEFTTGYGPRSGGRRRPHWNLLLKGIRRDQLDAARDIVLAVWCAHVDAKPDAQYVGEITDAGGLMKYIALHFQKESQAPPTGFRGQRFNCSRGYFTGQTRAEMRVMAKESLWQKRRLHEAQLIGLAGDEAEAFVQRARDLRAETDWRLYSASIKQLPRSVTAPASIPGDILIDAWAIAFDADVEHVEGFDALTLGRQPDTPSDTS